MLKIRFVQKFVLRIYSVFFCLTAVAVNNFSPTVTSELEFVNFLSQIPSAPVDVKIAIISWKDRKSQIRSFWWARMSRVNFSFVIWVRAIFDGICSCSGCTSCGSCDSSCSGSAWIVQSVKHGSTTGLYLFQLDETIICPYLQPSMNIMSSSAISPSVVFLYLVTFSLASNNIEYLVPIS